jgi:hypothetical protein
MDGTLGALLLHIYPANAGRRRTPVRLIKILSLAVIAAVAAMAFIGAGSASASVKKLVLCKANQQLCKQANLWGKHVTIKALSSLVQLTPLGVKCHSLMTILAEVSHEKVILGKLTLLDWSNCTVCSSVTTTTLPNATLLHVSGQDVLFHATSKLAVSLAGCILGLTCTATANTASLTFTGGTIGSTASIEANEVPLAMSGAFCGSEGRWNAGPGESNPYIVTRVEGETGSSENAGQFFSLESHA